MNYEGQKEWSSFKLAVTKARLLKIIIPASMIASFPSPTN